MKQIIYQAPAKVIFSGEHAVVFGKPALVSSLHRYLTVVLYELRKSDTIDKNIVFAAEKAQKYLYENKIPLKKKDFHCEITSTIPIGRGLGSSSAFSVALSASFLEFFSGRSFLDSKQEINNLAHQIEKRFHARPSGVDTSTSCFGGIVWFRKEFEFLKTISNLHLKIPKLIEENLYLIDTGKPIESTAEMVEQVGKEYNRNSKQMDRVFADMEKTTKRMVVALMKEDIEFFKKMISDSEALLEQIGVVSKKTQVLLQELRPFGIGKITGAGGKKKSSGFVLFFHTGKNGFVKFLENRNIPYMKFESEYKGVRRI